MLKQKHQRLILTGSAVQEALRGTRGDVPPQQI